MAEDTMSDLQTSLVVNILTCNNNCGAVMHMVPSVPFYFATCGHVLCGKCGGKNACPLCKKSVIYHHVNNSMEPKYKMYFQTPWFQFAQRIAKEVKEQMNFFEGVDKFQKRQLVNYNKLTCHMADRIKKMASEKKALFEELKLAKKKIQDMEEARLTGDSSRKRSSSITSNGLDGNKRIHVSGDGLHHAPGSSKRDWTPSGGGMRAPALTPSRNNPGGNNMLLNAQQRERSASTRSNAAVNPSNFSNAFRDSLSGLQPVIKAKVTPTRVYDSPQFGMGSQNELRAPRSAGMIKPLIQGAGTSGNDVRKPFGTTSMNAPRQQQQETLGATFQKPYAAGIRTGAGASTNGFSVMAAQLKQQQQQQSRAPSAIFGGAPAALNAPSFRSNMGYRNTVEPSPFCVPSPMQGARLGPFGTPLPCSTMSSPFVRR